MTEIQDWCRIVQINDVSVLFYLDFNKADDKYQIHAIIKTHNAMFDALLQKEATLSQAEFNNYASRPTARILVEHVKSLGHEPLVSPGGKKYVHRQPISMH